MYLNSIERGRVQFECARFCAYFIFSCSRKCKVIKFCIVFLYKMNIICHVYEFRNCDFVILICYNGAYASSFHGIITMHFLSQHILQYAKLWDESTLIKTSGPNQELTIFCKFHYFETFYNSCQYHFQCIFYMHYNLRL